MIVFGIYIKLTLWQLGEIKVPGLNMNLASTGSMIQPLITHLLDTACLSVLNFSHLALAIQKPALEFILFSFIATTRAVLAK